jgi:uncharacterized protein YjiS (DUF1127 family)
MTTYAIAKPAAIRDPRAGLAAFAARVNAWARRRIEIERTFNELNALTDRELDDLGFSRFDLRRIAAESVPQA